MSRLQDTYTGTITREDNLLWIWGKGGSFSAKSTYAFLNAFPNDGEVIHHFARMVWRIKVPLKIQAFLWLAHRNAILTCDNLIKRKWQGPNICTLIESIDHLLLLYPFIHNNWIILKDIFRLNCLTETFLELLGPWRDACIRKWNIKIWDIGISALCWSIWQASNDKIFNECDVLYAQLKYSFLSFFSLLVLYSFRFAQGAGGLDYAGFGLSRWRHCTD